MTNPTIIVTIQDIFKAHHWYDFCDMYQFDFNAVSDGSVDLDDTVSISESDCVSWQIPFLQRAHE